MTEKLENPFSVLKATEFTNEQIKEYWVEFGHGENSIYYVLNPTSDLPKYLLGSKGTGKTHILKYASFPLQKLKANNDYNKILQEKYIGLYYELSGFNASRFKGKGIDQYQWDAVFEYYLDLYLVDKLLNTYCELFENLNIEHNESQPILKEIVNILNYNSDLVPIETFRGLLNYITTLRKQIDSEVNNVAFTRKFDLDKIKSLFTPGDLIFGIPEIIAKHIPKFKEIKIIYILDEIEKLEEWQKVYINTLVWDKRRPVTFWLGMRTWGYTTWNTKSTEDIRDGHEFIKIDLDHFIAQNQNLYPEFAKTLYISRLAKFYKKSQDTESFSNLESEFVKKFEHYSEDDLINFITELSGKKELFHVSHLREALAGYGTKSQINTMVNELIGTESNPLFQKYKVFKFYKDWYNLDNDNKRLKRNWTLDNIIQSINDEYTRFKMGSSSIFKEIVDKRKKDFIAQLCVENNYAHKNIEHSGVESFIERSQCNPRNFLMILMKCVEIGNIKNEKPLGTDGVISLDTQFRALYDTSEWFYKTLEIRGDSARKMYDSLQCLSELLKLYRYCDKPTETHVFCFNVTPEKLSENAKLQLKDMETYSVIVKDGDRKEKNSHRQEARYMLNKTLCPLWGLPIKKRGVLDLNEDLANIVFDHIHRSKFENSYKKIRAKLTAPFTIENSASTQKTFEFPK